MPPKTGTTSRGRGRGGAAARASNRSVSMGTRPKPRPKMRPVPEPSPEPESEPELTAVGGKRLLKYEESEYGEDEIEKPVGPKKVRLLIGKKEKEVNQVTDEEEDELIDDTEIMEPVEAKKLDIRFAVIKGSPPKGVMSLPEPMDADISYVMFCLRVADAFGEIRETQELVWKTDRMPKSASWLALNNEKDFSEIIRQVQQVIDDESRARQRVIDKNIADAKKAKSRGKPFVPKEVPVEKEVVILLRDLTQEKRLKDKPKTTKKDKKAEKEEAVVAVRGLADRILRNEAQLSARKCDTCGKSCVVIPGIGANPAVHKELRKSDIKFWAQVAANGTDQDGNPASLEKPPRALLLQLSDRNPEQRGTKSKAQPPNVPPTPENPPAPVAPAPAAPVPPIPGFPPQLGPYPPPLFGPYNPYGFGNMAYGYYPGADPNPNHPNMYPHRPQYGPGGYGYGAVGPRASDPPLAEWLLMCDRGERGRHHDNFAGLLAGFTAERFTHLSHLRNLTVDDLMTRFEFPTTPGLPGFHMSHETATRLCQYVAADLPNYL